MFETKVFQYSRWGLIVLTFACAFASGCSQGPGRNLPVDPSKARTTLRAALDSWQSGDKMDALGQATPAIVVRDLDWESGYRLVEYKIQGDGEEMDAHLFCSVQLKLLDPRGREVEKEVTYIVATSPALTVFRKVF